MTCEVSELQTTAGAIMGDGLGEGLLLLWLRSTSPSRRVFSVSSGCPAVAGGFRITLGNAFAACKCVPRSFKRTLKCNLVGGFNPSETYASQNGNHFR